MQRLASQAERLLFSAIICLIAMVGAMWMHGDIGILQQDMVAGKAREAAALPTDWPLASASGDGRLALLFYAPDRQAFAARVYERRTGLDGRYLKLGWFAAGGWDADAGAQPDAARQVYFLPAGEDGQYAYFSLNAAGAAQAAADGAPFATVDPDAPFALLGPQGLAFTDAAGAAVPCAPAPAGQ